MEKNSSRIDVLLLATDESFCAGRWGWFYLEGDAAIICAIDIIGIEHMEEQLRYQQTKRVSLIGAATNICLGIFKVVFGLLGASHALVADGIHSLSDMLTDFLVMLASRFGGQAADTDHPYGHKRIETAATVVLALLIVIAGISIATDSIYKVFDSNTVTRPSPYVLLVALLSILANETLYRYTTFVANKINSNLLHANAWHHRSDAASSFVVLLGVAGSLAGIAVLDAVAAVIVGAMIIRMGYQLGWSSVRELVDTGVSSDMLAQIEAMITEHPGVQGVHQLRTRTMSDDILVDVHIQVRSDLTVSEGHYIAAQVDRQLQTTFKAINDVTVHVDPEPEHIGEENLSLPSREELLTLLRGQWQHLTAYDQIQRISLHYLRGRIMVEVVLPLDVMRNRTHTQTVLQEYQSAVAKFDFIDRVEHLYTLS